MPEEERKSTRLPAYVVRNRAAWTTSNEQYTAGSARESWGAKGRGWGGWEVAEDESKVVVDVRGLDVIELGCGTAYFGAWLKRLGARRVVGVDVTPAQLATAREMNLEFGLGLEFIEANAEDVPLPSASFDLAFSEYGASIWCDPYKWIPEAARLLRPGGELLFMRNSTLEILCSPDDAVVGERLIRPQKGMHHNTWVDEGDGGKSTVFHISRSERSKLLRDTAFQVPDSGGRFAPPERPPPPASK